MLVIYRLAVLFVLGHSLEAPVAYDSPQRNIQLNDLDDPLHLTNAVYHGLEKTADVCIHTFSRLSLPPDVFTLVSQFCNIDMVVVYFIYKALAELPGFARGEKAAICSLH